MRRPLVIALTLAATATGLAPAATMSSAADADAVRASAVHWAVMQAGTHEVGTSNCSARIDRWVKGMGLKIPPCRPWCGAFVHAAFKQAGVNLSARLIDPDRSYADARAGRRGLKAIAVDSVKPGDLLLFALRSGPKASHIAIVRTKPHNGKVRTIEGNVSHAVRLKTRGLRYAVLAARVTITS